jgi:1-acyl-sn-glycerol-3-phosphate acyltransferase
VIPLAYAVSKFVLWLAFRARYGLRVRGQAHVPRTGAFIVAVNHLSYLDPPAIGAACPRRVRFMARDTLFDHPLLGAFMRAVGVIPLQREGGDLAGLREAIRHLGRGECLAMFPEGARQPSGEIGQAKRGIGLLAEQARVPIVPAVVQGTFQALPPGVSRLQPGKIAVAFGPPIPYTTASTAPSSAGTAASRDRHEALAAAVTAAWRDLAASLSAPNA